MKAELSVGLPEDSKEERVDLFTPIVPLDQFHPNFAKCMERRNPYNESLLSKWAEGFIDRDNKLNLPTFGGH